MTSIKPPSEVSSGPPPAIEGGGARGPGSATAAEAFRVALDAPEAAPSASFGSPVGSVSATSAALVADLRAGRADVDAVVRALVERSRAQADASGLPPARRASLESMLRDALASDPTLQQLMKDLERGR
jgi:hypothetical protein